MNSQNQIRVVIVDDDLEIHERVTSFFKPKDFEVICYESAAQALEESLVTGNSWDVLLTDYHFPNMPAAEFTKAIKKNLPFLAVILLTPPDITESTLETFEYGTYDFIGKPIHFGQLLVAVNRALKVKSLIVHNSTLRELVKSIPTKPSPFIGRSPNFLAAIDIATRVAKSSASILITGESGTGKEVFANYIHNSSCHCNGPFTAINCSSIPESLLESELFGHTKGSFTGACENRVGLFEAAENGTLFLDEIGDLSLPLQAKLLRVLQEKRIKRVGENKERPINCRIISATHKDLGIEIQEGRFREDLFFRLNVIPISIPPLRERQEDLILLAETFLKKIALANHCPDKTFSKDAIKYLLQNRWQGNVRELENTVERAVVLCRGSEILREDFIPLDATLATGDAHAVPFTPSDPHTFFFRHANQLPTLDEVINKYIAYAIQKNDGARDKAAKEIGIDRKTLYRRMQSEGVSLSR
jgi:two-component system, NtrC family, response regulator HydG